MNARGTSFLRLALGGTPLAAGLALAMGVGAGQASTPAGVSPVVANAPKHGRYPTFKQVPPAPKDVRATPAWKSAVTAVQGDGKALAEQSVAQPWTLAGTDDFAARARAEAAPPPPITAANDPALDAVVAQMRARAKEPPRHR